MWQFGKETNMSVKRKDTKGRILRDGEIQKADGRYEFRYKDANGTLRSLYSWKLTESDSIPFRMVLLVRKLL